MTVNQVKQLVNILDLETLEHDLYRGYHPEGATGRVFGGQVVGQALAAAYRTVDESRPCHSLHAYFMLGGDPSIPILFQVERLRDGGSFTTRRVTAIQHGKAIYAMACSFHKDEAGLEHQIDMENVPKPDQLASVSELIAEFGDKMPEPVLRYFRRERPLDLKPIDITRYLSSAPGAPENYLWFRASDVITSDMRLHHCILAYASDLTLLGTSLIPHGKTVFDPDIMPASLDHAIWFHRPFDISDWLLYVQDSPSTHQARGFSRGLVYDLKGNLVASCTQEGLIRQIAHT